MQLESIKKGRTFCCGDIHGNYEGFKQALVRCNFNYDEDILISLGDLVDGHEQTLQVIELLYSIKNLILIKGNHDEWFKEWLRTGIHPNNWTQGQLQTAMSYLKFVGRPDDWFSTPHKGGYTVNLNPGDIPVHHQYLLNQQVNYYIDEKNRLFIHGGFNRHVRLETQLPYVYYWDRDLWSAALSYEAMVRGPLDKKPKFQMKNNFSEIFIGHTSTMFWDKDVPMKAVNIWNLDTGGGWTGRITIMDVDTKEFWQSDLALELYPDWKGRM